MRKECFEDRKSILKTIIKKRTADTLSPIANFTATSVNEKVYHKAPANSFLMRGFLRGLFGYFSECCMQF
jgi:hypothetical protein